MLKLEERVDDWLARVDEAITQGELTYDEAKELSEEARELMYELGLRIGHLSKLAQNNGKYSADFRAEIGRLNGLVKSINAKIDELWDAFREQRRGGIR